MRRWLLALAAVALVLALGVSLAARNLDAYLDANRDALARQAADALGREVQFSGVRISLRGGLGLRVSDLRVGDDPAFSSEPFLAADALEVQVALLPALRGRIEVERVVLRSPAIQVIGTAQGLSTASLGRPAAPPGAAEKAPSGSAPGALLVALVEIDDGTLRYVDRTTRPPVETVTRALDFRASDLAPGAPVAFEMEAAVLGSTRQNLRASGEVVPAAEPTLDVALALDPVDLAQALAGRAPAGLAASGSARLELRAKGSASDLAVEASLDFRDAELRLGDGFAKTRGRPLSLALSARRRGERVEIGTGELVVDETRVALRGSVEGLEDPKLRLEASSAVGSLRGLDYRDLALDLRSRGGKVEVEKLALAAHGGHLDATGSVDLRAPGGPAFEVRGRADGMSLESLLAAHAPAHAGRASGRLSTSLALRGVGSQSSALAGGGDLEVTDGVLRGFNPAGESLRALAGLPVLSGRKLGRLFESHPQLFGAEDTPFERIEARLEVAGGEARLRDGRLVAPDYAVRGQGRYAFGGRLHSSAVMAFSKPLSDEIVDAEKKLRLLRSPDGRVELPVVISGVPGDLSVQPDLAYVATAVSREALTGVVGGVLQTIPRPLEPGDGSGGEPPPASIEDAGRDLLRGLGGLLGGRPADEQE
jgi:uncharacterized protein YhdP